VRSLVPETPLIEAPHLSERVGRPVHLKLENLQITGSFKVRGAAARILSLDEEVRARGVVTCSSGNHGRAVAWVAGQLEIPAVVCVPDWVDPVKLEAIRAAGADARLAGGSYDEAAEVAHAFADEEGWTFVHPFDDPMVAAGQGSVGLEIVRALPDVGTVVVPLSGGGLAGGVGAAVRSAGRGASGQAACEGAVGSAGVRVVGASAERARVMVESLGAGRPVSMEEEETLANALSGGIELDNRCTFELVRGVVDEHVVVREDAIARAMAYALRSLHLVVEGGGAVGLAALLEGLVEDVLDGSPDAEAGLDGRPVVVVLSGGNVADEVLVDVLGRP